MTGWWISSALVLSMFDPTSTNKALFVTLGTHTAFQCSNPTWFVIIYPPPCWLRWIKFTPSTLKPTLKFSV